MGGAPGGGLKRRRWVVVCTVHQCVGGGMYCAAVGGWCVWCASGWVAACAVRQKVGGGVCGASTWLQTLAHIRCQEDVVGLHGVW